MPIKPANNIEVLDEGVSQGFVRQIDFTGAGISVAVSGSKATVTSGSGSFAMTTVEKNLGATAKWQGKFTVVDAAISPTSKVMVMQAPGPYTGKGTRADEAEMDRIVCYAEPGTGQMVVKWCSVESYVQTVKRNWAYNSFVPVAAARDIVTQSLLGGLAVRGKVKGNVKFNYAVA